MKYIPILPRWWKWGMPAPFWFRNVTLVKDAIKKYGLGAVGKEFITPQTPFASAASVAGMKEDIPFEIRWPPFPGGLRIPHLHFEGEVFLLSDDQWKDFSGTVVKDFQAKLERARTVNFEQFMELSDVLDGLP